jgi:NAD(P)-dependent dehydrogenase (short-subunit alcohol dehydrogenase family)
MARLKDKVCIITGATSGIGHRSAQVFSGEGAKLVIAGRREAEGMALAKALGPTCDFVRTDVTIEAQMQALIDFAVRKYGRIDCLFNNAGGPAPTGGIESIPVDGFDEAMALLVRSVMLGTKHVAPVMIAQKSGSIINTGSVAAIWAGLSSSMVYSAAKAAVLHLTRCVAMQLGEHSVRANSISPGGIATGIFGKAMGLPLDQAEQSAQVIRAGLAKLQPIPRAGITDDVALAAVFLASDESSFVNGHDLVVDGGLIGGRQWSAQQEGLRAMRNLLAVEG